MKPTQVKRMTCLIVCLALVPVVGAGFFLREPVLRLWYSRQLEAVEHAEKWDVALRLESLGEKGTKVAAGWYIKALRSRAGHDRCAAAARLGYIGAVTAVPVMLDLLMEAERRREVTDDPWEKAFVESLIRIGPVAIPAVCRLAEDPRGARWASELLVGLGHQDTAAIEALGRILTREHTHDAPDTRDGVSETIRMAIWSLAELARTDHVIWRSTLITRAPGAARLALETLVEGTSHHSTCQRMAATALLSRGLVKPSTKEMKMACGRCIWP